MASIPPSAALPDGRGLVTASFTAPHADPCERETAGACTLSRCPAASTSAAPPDAGEITVETGVAFASLSPDTGVEPDTYAAFLSKSVLYYGGELVKVSAKGGDVPAFVGTVQAPDIVSFTKPYTKPGETLTLDSTKDYACEWTATPDEVRFGVALKDSSSGAAVDVQLSCAFDGAKGAGSVPQALLAKLPKKQGALEVSARNQKLVTSGDFEITLRALAPAYGPTGASITTEVVIK